MIIDTNVVIERIKNKLEIKENPPILKYEKFTGEIYELEKKE